MRMEMNELSTGTVDWPGLVGIFITILDLKKWLITIFREKTQVWAHEIGLRNGVESKWEWDVITKRCAGLQTPRS